MGMSGNLDLKTWVVWGIWFWSVFDAGTSLVLASREGATLSMVWCVRVVGRV